LSGVNPPGTIVTSTAGDQTTGYPQLSMNYTSHYTFPSGWMKGIQVGGTAILGWFFRDSYYFEGHRD